MLNIWFTTNTGERLLDVDMEWDKTTIKSTRKSIKLSATKVLMHFKIIFEFIIPVKLI